FAQPANSYPITIVAVTELAHLSAADGNLKFQLRVDRIRYIAPNVPLDARAAQIGPDEVVGKRLLPADNCHACEPLDKDLVVREQTIIFVDDGLEVIEERGDSNRGLRKNMV